MKTQLNNILKEARDNNYTDIHIMYQNKGGIIRARKRGKMFDVQTVGLEEYKRLVNYLKFIADLDVNEYRIPQSGRIEIIVEDEPMNIRISTLPISLMNEVIVIRILNSVKNIESRKLFKDEEDFIFLKQKMMHNQGLILFTGPTGSGKSTIMYRLLEEIVAIGDRQVISIEDPIEFNIERIIQVEINEKAQLDYGHILRGVLRCDPDIIMFGEIRDNKIAKELVRASLSGHLVISTFHSKSAVSALMRLREFDILNEELKEALTLIINQRIMHFKDKSFIVYEALHKEEIVKILNDAAVEIKTIAIKVEDLFKKGVISLEDYLYFKETHQ
ncbi:ATPase, T2SS/T4P/T4SS family [Phocicoccus pinnipedialis]|uniref:Type II secretion system protein E n=1 Tax=Phocicoccus pinnipedialis TaxID=110845 RepID=A0A6V7RFY3_9BACL|nr:ATPase, T2SS/T4P/T4SS family [Jeotgalicoccus pinnipedialis]MBP1939301.1 competence protein ComGA [Jeotgalicoccus pinnipedialis]CAD2075968.1 Putative type II secretion system protein E [Jeotgalicoccus pinnipedialis]